MLSAFKARPLVELKHRDKSKIESILAFGDRLLTGLNNGSLRIYRVNETSTVAVQRPDNNNDDDGEAEGDGKTELLRELERFSRYKIEQLSRIKEANVLVSLSGGYVSLHDLHSFTLIEQLGQTKGATAFAVTSNIFNDPELGGVPSIVSRLAVAVKRKILLWTWRDMELEKDTAELTLVSGVKMLTFVSGTKLIAGLSSNFVLVDIEKGVVTGLAGPGSIGGLPQDNTNGGGGRFSSVGVASMTYIGMGGSVPKPLATKLSDGEILLAKDINTQFIDLDGNPLGRRQVPWSHAPSHIGYSYPFLLALHDPPKGVLEIRNPVTLSLLQSIPLPHASIMHIPHPNISLAHAGKGFLVASDRVIWSMDALSYDTQIDSLVENGYLDEAISLIGMLEDALLKDKEGRLRAIKLEKAQDLFRMHRYRDSMDLFTEISAPPEVVIRLFPPIIAGPHLSSVAAGEGEDEESSNGVHAPNGSTQSGSVTPVPEDAAESKPASHAPSIRSHHRSKNDDVGDSGSIRGKVEEALANKHRELVNFFAISPFIWTSVSNHLDIELKSAVRELQGYLADVRRRFHRFIKTDGSMKVKQPLSSGVADELTDSVTKLLGLSKDDTDAEFEERLWDKARLVDTTLFRAHMFATPSLAGSLFRIANFCDPDVVVHKLKETARYNDLIEFLYGKRLHRQALELLQKFGQQSDDENEEEGEKVPTQLHGPKRTVGYLQHLPPDKIDIILEFAEWPLRADPDLGMDVFLADTENSETLPRLPVLEFLDRIDSNLAIKYLEHVIEELNDLTPDLHQRLLILYLRRLQKHKSGECPFANDDESSKWWAKFVGMLKSSCQYSPAKMLDCLDRDGELR